MTKDDVKHGNDGLGAAPPIIVDERTRPLELERVPPPPTTKPDPLAQPARRARN